ncbi:hypothetical protein ABZS81_23595 [Streptomyces sp. NPDC005318]|uniref:hypothetical protein n=1 Tax=Streptomyces sp. NPDC005318 TaxID=3157031 RepID=UPI0033AB8234
MPHLAEELSALATALEPSPEDLRLAEHALKDTVAVSLAARGLRMARLAAELPEAARWAAVGHVLDCYAMQRPIGAVRVRLAERTIDPSEVVRILVRTPEAAVHPLIHARPRTGLQGKFSLEYAVAAALHVHHPGFVSYTDEHVRRTLAQRLVELVEIVKTPEGSGLLTGETAVEITTADGTVRGTTLALPPGSPELPATEAEFATKLADCGAEVPDLLNGIDWKGAAALMRASFPAARIEENA